MHQLIQSNKGLLFPGILTTFLLGSLAACGSSGGGGGSTVNLDISSVKNADKGASYYHSKPDIRINYDSIPGDTNKNGTLRDAIAYIDVDNDGDTDVFMATGEYLSKDETDSILALNDGSENFSSSTAEFGGDMPPATHARKTIVADFNDDGLLDMFVLDHGFDSHPYPGARPKLIMQDKLGEFSWTKMPDKGFHHGGAAADVDNDGDIDIFVGGNEPFFYINNGKGKFTRADDRTDKSVSRAFAAELIDVDKDGFVDLIIGAHEREGDPTVIYWGNSTGAYKQSERTVLPELSPFGGVIDIDVEDIDDDNDRDIILNRIRDGDDGGGKGFYIGRWMQLLENTGQRNFKDVTKNIDDPGGDFDGWFPWLRAQDIDNDGDIDLFSDDLGFNINYENDGKGNFTQVNSF